MIADVVEIVEGVAGGEARVVARRGKQAVRFLTTSQSVVDEIAKRLTAKGIRFSIEQGTSDTSGIPPYFVTPIPLSVHCIRLVVTALWVLLFVWIGLGVATYLRGPSLADFTRRHLP